MVHIELFGVPRLYAKRRDLDVSAETIGAALRELESACPELAPSVVEAGELNAAYLVALNGKQFTSDPATRLSDGDVLVIVSAHAGG